MEMPSLNGDAVQYTYIITDYTDDSGNTLDNIRMNLIIVSGRIVGGDICSAALEANMVGWIVMLLFEVPLLVKSMRNGECG